MLLRQRLKVHGGTSSIAQGAAGNFAISYSNVTDVVGGKGWNPGSAHTIGYNVGALSGSYNFVGIYGWTTRRRPQLQLLQIPAGE